MARTRGRPLKDENDGMSSAHTRVITASMHRKFQNLLAVSPSAPVFRGLCAYLAALLHWSWDLAPVHFDFFIAEYANFEKAEVRGASYHQWFREERLPSCTKGPRKVAILDRQILNMIADENPYSFAYARECLQAIAAQGQGALISIAPIASIMASHDAAHAVPQQYLSAGDDQPAADVQSPTVPELEIGAIPSGPWHAEKALRESIGVRDKEELLAWNTQGWVLDVYNEYCIARLDDRRAYEEQLQRSGHAIPRRSRTVSAQFILENAMRATKSAQSRYSQSQVDKTHWTSDDHDIRMIVQLVGAGICPGRWWEHRSHLKHGETLCVIGYRLLCWWRHIHHLSSAQSSSTHLQRAAAAQWYARLSAARLERFG